MTAIDTDPNIKLAIYWQQNKLESATFWTIGSRAIFRIACYLYQKKKREKMYVEPIRRDFVKLVEINPLRYSKIN